MGARASLLPGLLVGILASFLVAWQAVPRLGGRDGTSPAGREVDGARYRLTEEGSWRDRAPRLPDPAPMRFAPGTATADRDAVLWAAQQVRPEARRLLDLVGGVVEVAVAGVDGEELGRMRATGHGVRVELDLRDAERHGTRGVRRVVLHGLGHALDHALVPRDLEDMAERTIGPGWSCDAHPRWCQRDERFAESFARWASGDTGDLDGAGPRMPAPEGRWGSVLQRLR